MNENFYKELGSLLKEARLSKNLSQNEVANRINVGRSCISSWECGVRSVYSEDLLKLCIIYGIDMNELFNKTKKYLK